MLPFDENSQHNFDILRDCLCEPVVYKTRLAVKKATKGKSRRRRKEIRSKTGLEISHSDDAADLAEFTDYLALELFASLSPELQNISFAAIKSDEKLAQSYADPLPAATIAALLVNVPSSVTDSLVAYHLMAPGDEDKLLVPVFQIYVNSATSPPPVHNPAVRATACEVCERDWVPLSYHHLIPREVHAKALKRGWHEEWELQSVAWLCRACHGYVHKMESNEELAKNWWTVERLMSREDMQEWANWIGRVRCKLEPGISGVDKRRLH